MTTLSEKLNINKDNNYRLEKINYYISKLSQKQERGELSEKEFILLGKLKEQKNRLLGVGGDISESDIGIIDVFLSLMDKLYGGIKDIAFDVILDGIFDIIMGLFDN